MKHQLSQQCQHVASGACAACTDPMHHVIRFNSRQPMTYDVGRRPDKPTRRRRRTRRGSR